MSYSSAVPAIVNAFSFRLNSVDVVSAPFRILGGPLEYCVIFFGVDDFGFITVSLLFQGSEAL